MRGIGGSFGCMMYYLFEQPTEMKVDGQSINTTDQDIKIAQVQTTDTFNIDKSHPDFHYLNGGWMLED